ncbi:diacylglycerol/lipid kinase family protein [Sphingomonas sp. RS6]
MHTLWFITNPSSGTTSRAKCEALEAVFDERGLVLAGRTEFPADALPNGSALDAAGVDTVVLFAGDGTINAALSALAEWPGAFLILPGGTMNLLAKALHASTDPHAIIHAAHGCDRRVALPYVEAEGKRAFVGLILGPGASWFRAREAVRQGALRRLFAAARGAWRRTFGAGGVRIVGVRGLRSRYQAVFVNPAARGLSVAAVDARDWRTIAELGWEWVTGDWVAARAVTTVEAKSLRLQRGRPALALFDGEPAMLDGGTTIRIGRSLETFIATRPEVTA